MDIKNIKEYKFVIQTLLNKYFNFVIFGVMALILIIGFFVVISPKRQAIATESDKINNEKLITKGDLESLQRRISQYKKSFLTIDDAKRKKIDIMLPGSPRTGELMVQLEKLIKKKGLLLQSITVTTREDVKTTTNRAGISGNTVSDLPTGVGAVDISLKLQGINYEALKDLLGEFENNLRLMDVVGLGFSPGKSDLELKIVTYYSK